jgi:hypothetical protein
MLLAVRKDWNKIIRGLLKKGNGWAEIHKEDSELKIRQLAPPASCDNG